MLNLDPRELTERKYAYLAASTTTKSELRTNKKTVLAHQRCLILKVSTFWGFPCNLTLIYFIDDKSEGDGIMFDLNYEKDSSQCQAEMVNKRKI